MVAWSHCSTRAASAAAQVCRLRPGRLGQAHPAVLYRDTHNITSLWLTVNVSNTTPVLLMYILHVGWGTESTKRQKNISYLV